MSPEDNPFFEKPRKKRNYFVLFLEIIGVVLFFLFLSFIFIFGQNEVRGPSMLPSFKDGEILFLSRLHNYLNSTSIGKSLGFTYKKGDVVVFVREGFDEEVVKRIAALPGDRVQMLDGTIYVNDIPLIESFSTYNLNQDGGEKLINNGPAIIIPSNEYFLLGDNRPESIDSRHLGSIKENNIKGKVFLRIWPLRELSIIPRGRYL